MAKMPDDILLSQLQTLETDSADFVWGVLGGEREKAMQAYARRPYGNEEEGWSTIVTSEVQDTVEWVLPALLKVFTSTDRAVSFDPTRADEVDGAEQATDSCNYVFYKQNNGFLVLYTAIKDALTVKNCAVMWRKEKKRVKNVTPVKGASPEMLAMIMQEAGDDAEIESASPCEPQPMMGPQGPVLHPMTGQPVMSPQTFDARICAYEEKTTIKVEAFPPEDLLIKRDWTSPLLDDCPYVARIFPRITLSDLHEMGFKDVTAEDLSASDDVQSADAAFRAQRSGDIVQRQAIVEDESLTEGTLRVEFVLIDYDGDGIAERRCIYRLKDKILSNEECAQVPIATASPILQTHRWDGMSLVDCVEDLQALGTELTRQMLNSAYLANNPRTEVLTDAQGSPLADIDDLLDSRPGGILRKRQADAISQNITPWVGGQMFPMLEHVQRMGERRTGVSPSQQMDPNAIRNDRTAKEVQMTANAAAARIDLVARIFAELLLKPVFKGILKLLTDGEMEKIAFRLRDKFVEYDPQEWRDSYDMTISVGLGTGDKEAQGALLQAIFQNQMGLAQSPFGPLLVSPKEIYNTQAKMVELSGHKNVGDFWIDPQDKQVPPPQQPPDPQVIIAEKKLQAEAQRFQAETIRDDRRAGLEAQVKRLEQQAQLQLQQSNDERDAQREAIVSHYEAQLEAARLQLERYETDANNRTRIEVALINKSGKLEGQAMANQAQQEQQEPSEPAQEPASQEPQE